MSCSPYRRPFSSVAELAQAADPDAWQNVEWREGTRGPMRSRFMALRIRPANLKLRRADPDGELPVRWLLAEWPDGKDAPTDYWISNRPADTPIQRIIELAKLRWRVEQDYRELKDALGLDHFEGRSWPGWHHHVTLVSVAHGFLTSERLRRPPSGRPPDLAVRGRPGAPDAPGLLAGHLPNLPQTAAAHHRLPPQPTMT
jgi:SRSO17 transposase